jgi:hypothetical protein
LIPNYLEKEGMSFWGILVLLLIGAFIFFMYIGNKESEKAGKEAGDILSRIENKYDGFIVRKIQNSILQDDTLDFDQDRLFSELMVLLKPDINALISHINSTRYSSVKTIHQAMYFTNLAPLINEMFIKSRKNFSKVLNEDDEAEIFKAFEDIIKADMMQRTIQLKEGFI